MIVVPKLIEAKKEIHKVACKNCPSIQGIDPECEEILKLPHSERVKTAFACGWRPTKYCKGYCDQMGITLIDILNL